jgi:hypothetical protein
MMASIHPEKNKPLLSNFFFDLRKLFNADTRNIYNSDIGEIFEEKKRPKKKLQGYFGSISCMSTADLRKFS